MALAVLDAEEAPEEAELEEEELAEAELEAVGEELLQPATTSPMQARDASVATCAPRR